MYSVLRNNLHGKIIWERIYIYAYAKLFNVLEHGAYCVLLGVSGMFALSTESLLGLLVLRATPGWLWGVYIVLHTILAGFFFFSTFGEWVCSSVVWKEKDDYHPVQWTPVLHAVSVPRTSTECERAAEHTFNMADQATIFYPRLLQRLLTPVSEAVGTK